MKALEFAVVVQWGGGHIYFLSFHETGEEAQLAANRTEIRENNKHNSRRRRGAKPSVMVWRKLSTGLQLVPTT